MKRTFALLIVTAGVILAIATFRVFLPSNLAASQVASQDAFHVEIPTYQKPGVLVQLEQGWKDEDRTWFHHTPQGTQIMPYKWFLVLEQPCLKLEGCGKFSDPEYLGRFGFIAEAQDPKWNPAGLPIGFAIDQQFRNPLDGSTSPVVGFTCAACHTAELHYGNHAIRIEGAPAMVNFDEFLKATGKALTLTLIPTRYSRFEKNVLGPDATLIQKARLFEEFQSFMNANLREQLEGDEKSQRDAFASGKACCRILRCLGQPTVRERFQPGGLSPGRGQGQEGISFGSKRGGQCARRAFLEHVEAGVGRNPVEPGAQRSLALEGISVLPGSQHGLLHQILSLVQGPQQAITVEV